MSEDLDRYFAALHQDSDDPVLADAAAIRRTGDRRTRTNRAVGTGVACLAALAAVAGVTTLTGHGGAPQVPAGPEPSVSTTAPAPPASTAPPSTEPSSPPPSRPASAAHDCGLGDFGTVSGYSDGAMGTEHWVVTVDDVATAACVLDTRASVWLTDPDTGQDVKLRPDSAASKVTVRPGQQLSFALTMPVVGLESTNDPSCRHAVTYRTLKVALAGGVLVARDQIITFTCKGHNDGGPTVGGWGAG